MKIRLGLGFKKGEGSKLAGSHFQPLFRYFGFGSKVQLSEHLVALSCNSITDKPDSVFRKSLGNLSNHDDDGNKNPTNLHI